MLAQAVPVYWVYVTAWATPDGIVQFRDDIYQRDGLGNSADAQAFSAGYKPKASPNAKADDGLDP